MVISHHVRARSQTQVLCRNYQFLTIKPSLSLAPFLSFCFHGYKDGRVIRALKKVLSKSLGINIKIETSHGWEIIGKGNRVTILAHEPCGLCELQALIGHSTAKTAV